MIEIGPKSSKLFASQIVDIKIKANYKVAGAHISTESASVLNAGQWSHTPPCTLQAGGTWGPSWSAARSAATSARYSTLGQHIRQGRSSSIYSSTHSRHPSQQQAAAQLRTPHHVLYAVFALRPPVVGRERQRRHCVLGASQRRDLLRRAHPRDHQLDALINRCRRGVASAAASQELPLPVTPAWRPRKERTSSRIRARKLGFCLSPPPFFVPLETRV